MAGKNLKSGGKRAVERKHLARDAARVRDGKYLASRKKMFADIGGAAPPTDPGRGYAYLAKIMLAAIHDCLNDPGLPPEQQREQLGRLAAQTAKILEPADMSQQIADLEEALEKAQRDASYITTVPAPQTS